MVLRSSVSACRECQFSSGVIFPISRSIKIRRKYYYTRMEYLYRDLSRCNCGILPPYLLMKKSYSRKSVMEVVEIKGMVAGKKVLLGCINCELFHWHGWNFTIFDALICQLYLDYDRDDRKNDSKKGMVDYIKKHLETWIWNGRQPRTRFSKFRTRRMSRILEFLADRRKPARSRESVATKGERSLNDLSAAEERSGKSLNKTLLAGVWHRWPFGVL